MRAYRKRLKKKNPKQHHLNKLKDRVRKRKKLYATYTEEKKLTRITQRVIYAVYVKHYSAEDNELFKDCFPEIVQEPDCFFYLFKDEIDFFESYYKKNPSERRSRWSNAYVGARMIECADGLDEVMGKLQTLKDECAL